MDPRDPRHPAPTRTIAAWQSTQPTTQQFQQAAAGFVLPGAVSGQAPLVGSGGFIGAPGMDIAQQQSWAFPTPKGLQLVQHGASATVRPYPAGTGPVAPGMTSNGGAGPEQAAIAGAAPQPMRLRLRWETIVPFVAIMCVVATACLVVARFDSITGHQAAARGAQPSTTSKPGIASVPTMGAAMIMAGSTPKQRIAAATRMLRAGSFEEAAATLDPLLAHATPPAAALRLDARIAASSARNGMLLTRLTRQQSARDWRGALVTLVQLKRLRPLSAPLLADARQARAKLLLAKTRARTRTGTRAHVRRAAPSVGVQPAPRPGGQGAASAAPPAARPPSSVPSGSLPPRPDAPNTGGGGGAVTGGGPGSNAQPAMADMPSM